MTRLTLRFHGELNESLPRRRRDREVAHDVEGSPAVKDVIEALGVPHTEVDAIVVNDAADFAYRVRDGDAVAVYPRGWKPAGIVQRHLQPPLPAEPRFVLDVHLGRLAAYLRMLGFDSWYATGAEDAALAELAEREGRILLTRDVGLLKRGNVQIGAFLRASDPERQLAEILERFQLSAMSAPFTRCLRCNACTATDSSRRSHKRPSSTACRRRLVRATTSSSSASPAATSIGKERTTSTCLS
jgi:uncharacterized protein with PIN domain